MSRDAKLCSYMWAAQCVTLPVLSPAQPHPMGQLSEPKLVRPQSGTQGYSCCTATLRQVRPGAKGPLSDRPSAFLGTPSPCIK